MPQLDIDLIIFIAFLATNLIVGLTYGQRVTNLREYAIGNKTFSTATLTATLLATYFGGGSLVYGLEQNYSKGLYHMLANLGAPIGLLLTGRVVGVRMAEFLNNLSIADAMHSLYGRTVQIITATSGILGIIGRIAMQFQVISKILAIFFALNNTTATLIAASIIILYSAFGGIKSVTFTDVIQFITFGTFIPVLALTIWNKIQDPHQVIETLTTNPIFNIQEVVSLTPDFMATLGLLCYFTIPGLAPEVFQRVAMANNIKQVKRSFTYSAGLTIIIFLFYAWMGVLLITDSPGLSKEQVFPYLVTNYTYPGLKGFFVVGVMALAMSTADSALNSSAVMFANDVVAPLKLAKYLPLTIARFSSLILGAFSLALALYTQDLLNLLLLSGSFYMPIVTVPMLLAIFGFRSTTRVVIIGMAAGFITVISWLIFFKNANSIVPGMLANFIFCMGSHYLLKEKGGWVKKDKALSLVVKKEALLTKKKFLQSLRDFAPIAYLEKNLPQKEYFYSLLSFYLLTATYASLYNISQDVEQAYLIIYRIIQYSVLLITTSLIVFPIWPLALKHKRFLTFLWPTVIFYALFLVGGALVIMSNFQTAQVLIFMLNLVITVLLIDWPLALGLAISGFIAAAWYFQQVMQVDVLAGLSAAISFKISYGLLLFSSLLIALVRHKQAQAHLAIYNAQLLENQRETRQELVRALNYREELLQELNPDEVALFDSTTTAYIQQAIYRIKNYLRLDVTTIELADLLAAVQNKLKIQGLGNNLKIQQHAKQHILQADVAKIEKLLMNSIVYIQKHNDQDQEITLTIEDTLLGHKIAHIQDYTRKLEAVKFTITTGTAMATQQAIYMISPTQSQIPQDEAALSLAENARIIDAHYGYADTQQTNMHIYVIPTNVRAVRGKVMELLREPAAADPQELSHPLAIKLEKELLTRLQDTAVNLGTIHKALDTIKKYHGGVKRKSGEPFFTHPMAVALILLDYSKDQDAIIAALLHDTVEDTRLSTVQVKAMFGETVAFLVSKATNLEDSIRRISLEEHENLHRLMNYEDQRAALVKLADRLHNMRTIIHHPSLAKQKHIAKETLTFFVPMAKQLHLEPMAQELEKLSLASLGRKA